jgi:Domain of unknown function (DUF4328)
MTTGYGFAPPADRVRYVRCARCSVPQPPPNVSGRYSCVACGAALQRWFAHPPAGVQRPTKRKTPDAPPYFGPPAYRGGHPRWSFPSLVWRELPTRGVPETADDPTGALGWVATLCVVTAISALIAAGSEIWRFVLMLQGRTLVLSGPVVRASDVLVAFSGIAVVVLALSTAAMAVPALVRTHAAAARRQGRAPSRTPRAVVARLIVPGWNIYGAGQIVTEIDRTLATGQTSVTSPDPRPRRRSPLTTLWWLGWVASAALIIATLARGLGGSLQAIADTVQLHIAVDLLAAVVAVLSAAIFRRFARLLTDRPAELNGWVVQPPVHIRSTALPCTDKSEQAATGRPTVTRQ